MTQLVSLMDELSTADMEGVYLIDTQPSSYIPEKKDFKRCIICPSTSIHIYNFSSKILSVDAAHLKGPFGGLKI